MRSKRWSVRGARAQGDSACREMHGGLPQPCEGRQTAENTWAQANPLSASARSPAARGVVNVRDQGHRRRDHDEAVKMVNVSRTKKPTKCDLFRANRCCRARGSPGVGRRSVTATRFARVSIWPIRLRVEIVRGAQAPSQWHDMKYCTRAPHH